MLSYQGVKIRKRKDGRYEARPTINGKRLSIYAITQRECLSKLKETLTEQKKIVYVKVLNFSELYDLWYLTKVKSVTEGTLKNIRSIFKNYIFPKINADAKIKDIKLSQINDCILLVDKLRMREYCSQYLREIFYFAYIEKHLKTDISDRIIKYTKKRDEGTALTVAQRKSIVENSKYIDTDIFVFYMFSGCRRNELLNIKGCDILKDSGLLHIPGTKTEGSNRYIPLFDILKNIIDNKNCGINDLLYNISESTIKRRLLKLKELCGFNFTIKDLRTTFGTMCAEMGVQSKVIAKWMGHTSEKTTHKYYIKVLTDFEKEQISLFNKSADHTFDHTFDPEK